MFPLLLNISKWLIIPPKTYLPSLANYLIGFPLYNYIYTDCECGILFLLPWEKFHSYQEIYFLDKFHSHRGGNLTNQSYQAKSVLSC